MEATSQERLPAGWAVEFKVQKSGRRIKYYMNSQTGQKFFSKEDLLRYIKMKKTQVHEPQQTNGRDKRHSKNIRSKLVARKKDLENGHDKRCLENSSMELVAEENNHPEWLPDGWIVELKTRMSGSAIGKQYKVYIDPLTGCKFFSKPEVLRHLESTKHKNFVRERKTVGSGTSSSNKVVVEKSTVVDLPPGWIKETKIKKTAHGVRKDPYYTDPVTGYVFRSKKDVFRYLETGEISKYAFKPAKGATDDPESINEGALALPDAKKQPLEHPAARRQLFPGTKSSDACSPALQESEVFPKMWGKGVSAVTDLAGAPMSQISPEQMAEMTIEKGAETKGSSSLRRLELAKFKGSLRHQGKSVFADNASVATSTIDSLQGQRLLQSQINYRNGKSKQKLNLLRRSSKRLAGLEPELVANSEPIEQAPKNVTTESCKSKAIPAAGLTSSGLVDEVCWQLEAGSVMERGNHILPEGNIPSSGGQSSKIRSSVNQVLPEEQPKMLKSAETIGDKSEQEVSLFFGDSYLDPCLESAFKALMSAIPGNSNPDNGPVSTPVADILQENNLLMTELEKSSGRKTQINSVQSRNKRELSLPRRSSNRLAGLEPEMVANSVSIERVPRMLNTESTEKKAIRAAGLNSSVLVTEKFQLLKAIFGEQSAEINDGKSEPLITSSSGNSYLDPCKALIAETMVGYIPDNKHVSTTEAGVLLENLQETKVEKSNKKKIHINGVKSKNKEELCLPRRSSKRLAGLGPELMVNLFSCERASGYATIESYKSEVLMRADVDPHGPADSTSLQLEAGHETTLVQHDCTDIGAPLHEKSPNKSCKLLEGQTVSGDQSQKLENERLEEPPQRLENEKVDNENPDSHLLFPFGDSWSDPCLEFAFKTLTGAIPVDDNLAIQDYCKHQLHSSNIQKDGGLVQPDFGSIDFCQTNFGFQLDAPEKQPASQLQSPANPLLPPENFSLPSCSTVASEEHCFEGNKEFDGKVSPS